MSDLSTFLRASGPHTWQIEIAPVSPIHLSGRIMLDGKPIRKVYKTQRAMQNWANETEILIGAFTDDDVTITGEQWYTADLMEWAAQTLPPPPPGLVHGFAQYANSQRGASAREIAGEPPLQAEHE